MRRTVLVVPGWSAGPEGPSVLREGGAVLEELSERGRAFRIAPVPPVSTPEASWLGIDPSGVALQPGPLAVAAFGADPPERSVQFHLSVVSLSEGSLDAPEGRVPVEIEQRLIDAARRLETSRLKFVSGSGLDHGLVWLEGSIELETTAPEKLAGAGYDSSLPHGDGEPILRRFIDDSVNVLADQEFNARRIDEGLPPLNALWPWGQGFRERVPNLWLQRGERLRVESGSLRLAGLARLTASSHGDLDGFGRGTNVRLEALAETLQAHAAGVALIDSMRPMRSAERWDELAWFSRRVEEKLLAPLLDSLRTDACRLLLLVPGEEGDGLGLWVESGPPADSTHPFDERLLDDPGVVREDLWRVVDRALAP